MRSVKSVLSPALVLWCMSSAVLPVSLSAGDSVVSPGDIVVASQIKSQPLEGWFTSAPVDDEVFARMKGKSFKDDCTLSRDELRYLRVLHVNGEGQTLVGEMVCNKAIAADLLDIFKSLYEARYPIGRMVLIDNYGADDVCSMEANNTSCFNFRKVAGSSKLSAHSRGMAVDINPLYNPYVKRRKDGTLNVSPEGGRRYVNRAAEFEYKITTDDLAYKLFTAHGFKWGGEWKSLKDYQHFER